MGKSRYPSAITLMISVAAGTDVLRSPPFKVELAGLTQH